jgi:hypothetical protein
MLIAIIIYITLLSIIAFIIYRKYKNKPKNKFFILTLELTILFFTFFGIIPLITDFEEVLTSIKKERLANETYSNIHYALILHESIRKISCDGFITSKYSPDNLDDILKQYRNTCEWSKSITMPTTDSNALIPEAVLNSIPEITNITLKSFTDDFLEVSKNISEQAV